MATKTLTIREEVYNRLKSLKREGESFSDLLERLTKQLDPDDLISSIRGIMEFEDSSIIIQEIRQRREDWRA